MITQIILEVFFDRDSKETFQDKLLRVIRAENLMMN
ncbi:MAG: transposon-encoded TnpW family protein [Clostridiales bacterium]|nr:transposon-encoded TnpW family protein [Clostridiales bacterium]MDR2711923.1 transposon-encoded TnpW family protein [Clostridiales bacterium]